MNTSRRFAKSRNASPALRNYHPRPNPSLDDLPGFLPACLSIRFIDGGALAELAVDGAAGAGEEAALVRQLIADAGLVGLPNAGKSTFLAAVSNARPKIADYPFTTLVPNLGVVGIDGKEFVMADIPGLIEGASEGRGLGTQFLAHVERCKVLLHLVDGTSSTITKDYRTIVHELEAYSDVLGDKPRILALNKVDAMDAKQISDRRRALEKASGGPVHVISGVAGRGVQDVLRVIYATIEGEAPQVETGPWQP